MSVLRSYIGGRQKADRANAMREMLQDRGKITSGAEALKDAFAAVESSGRYDAVGPQVDSGRAYGRYQVMDFNIGPWTEKYFGERLTPEAFLANPEAQDAVFLGEMGQYYDRFGNLGDMASMWFSGKPYEGNTRSDGYNTVPEYVSKVRAAYNPMEGYLR